MVGELGLCSGFTAKNPRAVLSVYKLPDHQVQDSCGGAPRGSFVIQPPDIQFSEWYSWDDVKNIPNSNRTGLYIIARFDDVPEGAADPLAKEIIYIGETHGGSQTISKRLTMFFKAARIGGGVHKHSGGNRFNRELGADLTNIYAAGFAPEFDDKRLLNPFIFYAERKLIWEYVVKHGTLPLSNGY